MFRLPLFFALILVTAGAASGLTLSVTFDAALTNGTGWSYSDGFVYVADQKAYGFKANGDAVRSPAFAFNVTSVTVRANLASEKTKRTLWVVPTAGAEGATDLERQLLLAADGSTTDATAAWSPEDRVTAVAFYMRGSSGRVYLREAAIAGVPSVAAPTDPAVEVAYCDRFTAVWRNPPEAAANEIDVRRIVREEPSVDWWWSTDFAAFTNGLTTTEITDRLAENYPGFGGSRLYAPQNTNGIVRIGSRDVAGVLTFSPVFECAGRNLVLRAWRENSPDEGWIAPVDWIFGGKTNALGSVTLGYAPKLVALPLDGVPDGAAIAVHSTTNRATSKRSNGRLYVDRFGIADAFTPGQASTTSVARVRFPAAERRKVRGLERDATYDWAVRAIGAEGGVSPWSERRTAEGGGLPAPGLSIVIR